MLKGYQAADCGFLERSKIAPRLVPENRPEFQHPTVEFGKAFLKKAR